MSPPPVGVISACIPVFSDATSLEETFAETSSFRGVMTVMPEDFQVEGIENVPSDGGALLVSNHAGALPPDAAMIGKAIKEEHPRPRPLHLTVEHFFKGYPGFSMLVSKVGGVPAHPANVHRLLHDEEQVARSTLLEVLVIVLIAVELVVAILGLRGFH